MKKFYRCKICGNEFCLKGRKYCEEGGDVICNGNVSLGLTHSSIKMEFAGNTIEDLRKLRKKQMKTLHVKRSGADK